MGRREPQTRFLRPLPSLLIWLDYKTSGYTGFWPHVHSFAWWSAAVLGAYVLFRRLLPARAAQIATLFFAISPAHTVPIWWLANRSVLVSVALGSWALAHYASWRESGRARDGIVTCLLWTATFLTGEYALCFAAYVAAIEVLRRDERLRQRMLGIVTFVAPAAAYLVVHRSMGFGVHGSTMYRNPVDDFGGYLEGAPRAIAVLLGSAWLGLDEGWSAAASPDALALLLAVGAAAIAIALGTVLRDIEAPQKRRATWLLTGSFLAILPIAAAQPSARVLGVAVLGVAAQLGIIVDGTWRAMDTRSQRTTPRLTRFMGISCLSALVLMVAHFVYVPLSTYRFTKASADEEPMFGQRLDWVREHRDPSKSTVVVLRATTPPTALCAPFMLRDAAPDHWRVLTQTFGRVIAIRSGPRSLDMVGEGNAPIVSAGYMTPEMTEGNKMTIPGMTATVIAIDDQRRPRQVRFEFDRDLDDPSLWWTVEGANGFREVHLPPINSGLRLQP